MSRAAAALLLLAVSAGAAPRYAGRPLAEVLAELGREGLKLVWSEALVTPGLRVREEPTAAEPVERLRQMLRPLGLEARRGPGDAWLVVASETRPRPAPTPAAVPRYQETLDVVDAAPSPGPAPLRLEARAVEAVAGAGENVFRTLQTLPGITAVDDADSRLSVRGGGPDQNLTLMDGVEVHNPFRLLGLASAFNPDLVERFELFPGTFDARYGDRLSSILVVDNRLGTSAERFRGTGSLSLTDANLVLEGRLPRSRHGSWLVSGRRTYYDLVAERYVDDELPSFWDVQARLGLELSSRDRLSLLALASREGTRYASAEDGEDYEIDTHGENLVLSGAWSRRGDRSRARAVFAYTRFEDTLDFAGRIESDARASNAPGQAALSDVGFARRVEIGDLSLRAEADWRTAESTTLTAGFEVHRMSPSWSYDVGETRLDGARNGTRLPYPSGLPGAGLPDQLDASLAYSRSGIFTQLAQAWGPLRVRAGLRVDVSSLNRRASLEPRLGATWSLGPRLALHAAGGLYAQTPGYEKSFQADSFVDLGKGSGLDNERALQGALGARLLAGSGVELTLDVYGRRFDRLLIGRLETAEENAVRLARYDYPDWLAGEIPSAPLVTVVPENAGEGQAWGVELLAARRATSAATRLTGWIAYSYGRAEREAWGERFPFDYDRRHAASLVGACRVARRFELAATARAASGFPYTSALRARLAEDPDVSDRDGDGNRGELVPALDPLGRPVFTPDFGDVANVNRARMPAYFRLDLRLSFRPRGPQGAFSAYLDLINVTDRENAGQVNSIVSRRPGELRPAIVERPVLGVPFLPSLGIRWSF